MGGFKTNINDINYEINARIRVGNDLATIKYIGEVKDYTGTWIGVEWDNIERGKHNGTINNIQYFETLHPKSGSMIRIEKIQNFESVSEAIENRYICSSDTPMDEKLMQETQRNMRANIFEFVGINKTRFKQSHWQELYDISIAYSNVSYAGDLEQLTKLHILNLTGTLIWNWNIVATIVKQLPNLKYLILSENRLQLPNEHVIIECKQIFSHIEDINLRKCGIGEWESILQIAKLWPNIKSLSLQDNEINKLSVFDCKDVFCNLKYLDLQSNNINNFEELLKLGNISTLEYLCIINNNIKQIEFPMCSQFNEKLKIFKNLKDFNIRDNPIVDEIKLFNELDKLQSLESLTYNRKSIDLNVSINNKRKNDYLIERAHQFEEMFSSAIGMIGALKMLNRIPITNEQRRGAEFDLWKKFAKEWIHTSEDIKKHNEFLNAHRTYQRLIDKYGSPEDMIASESVKPKSNLIQCNIIDSMTNKTIQKRIPYKISVQTLHGLVLKLFPDSNGSNRQPKLSYIDSNRTEIRVAMDNLSKSLDFYSIQEGDCILVDWI